MSASIREQFVDVYTILHVTDQGEVIKVSLKEAVVYPEDLVRKLPLQKKAEAEDDGNLEELPAVKEMEESEESSIAKTDKGGFFFHSSRVQLRASPTLQPRPL
ncbi:hypothetical protein ARSEF1564_001667 [Beauveria bassiana]